MRIIETQGNRELMERNKTLFLCSKKTPIRLYNYVFDWTDSLTEHDCIACFNSTQMEDEVVKALLVARIPTILFVMNRFTDVNNIQIEQALKEQRILIVVLKRDEPQEKGLTPRIRNEYVMSLCQRIVCGYVNKNGSVFGLVAGRSNVEKLIDDQMLLAAEPEQHKERWTVAQDKILLRMYYADMGIHAIHKRLKRSYSAVYARILSITQPEDLLKGREFEDYVLGLFNIQKESDIVLQEWQGDKSYGLINPENNSYPDFVLRYGTKEFAVECKWREKLQKELDKDIFTPKRIETYTSFSHNRNIPVTIVLGVGGQPSYPGVLYVIPLENITSIISHAQSITEYICEDRNFNISLFTRTISKKHKTYTIDEKRALYHNAYKPWNKDDDDKLLALNGEGKTLQELSTIFQRKPGAIRSRLRKLLEQ
ncbi:MAG: hypothetical protein IJ557_07545 [Bacteroidaceae bacterium]|nr:hypothetical protein [Bacteroidaceae bacterium]